MKVILGYGFDF
ncbi:hypothetical protein YPPY08_1743, partial [Yersinia pestis PY-08]